MNVERALSQISEIHAQLLKSEVFRGYRSWPMAATGGIALATAGLQATMWPPRDGLEFSVQWLVVAGICLLICTADLVAGYRRQSSASERRRTLRAVGQFVPAVLAGGVVTAVLTPTAVWLLPGLWALLFSLGLFSSRLHLPRITGGVALWYLAAGAILLVRAEPGSLPAPWGMGLCFGLGQLALAWIFFAHLERGNDGAQA